MEVEKPNEISISVLKGDKLFDDKKTPFVINISSPQPSEEEKKCNADLICVIDISGSMNGEKIDLVKESLKILVEMMDKNDRLSLILFDNNASILFNLDYMNDNTKKDILKKEKDKTKENRVSSIILLSDGCDNYLNDIELAESLKKLTKGLNLSFTLNTFGYGYDHDPKIMNKLANIRDGSFFLVEDYKKVAEYFVTVLGGCVSVISKKCVLNVKLLNKDCKIEKIFGADNLYSYELKPDYFNTTMLQFICGKEYTFVFEFIIDENSVKVGDELLDIIFIYEDINQNNKEIKKECKYKYELTDLQLAKANEEYIRSQVYYILDEALKLREDNKVHEAKKLLSNMEDWLKAKYKGTNKTYLEDIIKTKSLFRDEYTFKTQGISYVSSNIREKQSKRAGATMIYSNAIQANYSKKAQSYYNKNNI